MISLGNDVVDLNHSDTNLDEIHSRFITRILNRDELNFFSSSRMSKKYLLWTYWAAKESAYKALKRLLPNICFHYKQFTLDYNLKKVFYRSKTPIVVISGGDCHTFSLPKCKQTDDFHYEFNCKIDHHKNYIHVVSFVSIDRYSHCNTNYKQEVFSKKNLLTQIDNLKPDITDSQLLRMKLIQRIAKINTFEEEDIQVQTLAPDSRTPYLFHKGKRQDTVLTLSHHGDYLAFAFS